MKWLYLYERKVSYKTTSFVANYSMNTSELDWTVTRSCKLNEIWFSWNMLHLPTREFCPHPIGGALNKFIVQTHRSYSWSSVSMRSYNRRPSPWNSAAPLGSVVCSMQKKCFETWESHKRRNRATIESQFWFFSSAIMLFCFWSKLGTSLGNWEEFSHEKSGEKFVILAINQSSLENSERF